MLRLIIFCVLLGSWGAAALAHDTELEESSRTVVLPPQPEPKLLGGLTFAVRPGVRSIVIAAVAEDPEQDVDLYIRFGRSPAMRSNGSIIADYRSETVGGAESIEIDPFSSPPLQTGRYYVALVPRTLNEEIRVVLRCAHTAGGDGRAFLISTFEEGFEDGWTRNFPPVDAPGATVGDSATARSFEPGGFYRLADTPNDVRRDFAVAPEKFTGNLSAFDDARFEYRTRHAAGAAPVFRREMRLIGPAGAYRWRGSVPETNDWVTVRVALREDRWERVAGEASFAEVLSNVTRVEVSMDHSVGAESNDLDDFTFSGAAPRPVSGAGAPVSSDFESGLDGWGRNTPASPIPFATIGTSDAALERGAGGSQGSDRYLRMIDGGGRNEDYVVAPDEFVRGLAQLERPWYELDYRRFAGAFPQFPITLRLLGNGAVYEWRGPRSRDVWLNLRIPVNDDHWVHVAGPDDFDAMLRDVQRLEVIMDAAPGPEVNGLDNFRLWTEFTPTAGRALELSLDEVSLETTPGAGEQSVEIEIRTRGGGELGWTARLEPEAPWVRLDQESGETPATTRLLFDPASAPPGRSTAELVVEGDEQGVRPKRIPVTLLIVDDPRAPQVESAGAAADPLLPLSPGGLGSLFGRSLATESRAMTLDDERLPLAADGVEILFRDAEGELLGRAPLLYVSPEQLNFQTPYELAGRDAALLIVRRAELESEPLAVETAAAAPAIFELSEGAAIVNADGALNSPANRAAAGEIVTVYFTGLGPVRPPLETGRAAPLEPLRLPELAFAAEVDERDAAAFNAALTPAFVGLAQMGVEIPADLTPGRRSLRVAVGGRVSNAAPLWVE